MKSGSGRRIKAGICLKTKQDSSESGIRNLHSQSLDVNPGMAIQTFLRGPMNRFYIHLSPTVHGFVSFFPNAIFCPVARFFAAATHDATSCPILPVCRVPWFRPVGLRHADGAAARNCYRDRNELQSSRHPSAILRCVGIAR